MLCEIAHVNPICYLMRGGFRVRLTVKVPELFTGFLAVFYGFRAERDADLWRDEQRK